MASQSTLRGELLNRFSLPWHPWDQPDPHCGVMPGAADGWSFRSQDLALLFHTTTEANAAAILRDGFRPSEALEVGGARLWGLDVPGREMPPGIWASIRPTVPNDSDTWMPDVCQEPWAVLYLVVPLSVLRDRCVFEHTWPVAQFCLTKADVGGLGLLPPEQMARLIHPETVRKIASFRSDYHIPSPYLDALDAAAAPLPVVVTP